MLDLRKVFVCSRPTPHGATNNYVASQIAQLTIRLVEAENDVLQLKLTQKLKSCFPDEKLEVGGYDRAEIKDEWRDGRYIVQGRFFEACLGGVEGSSGWFISYSYISELNFVYPNSSMNLHRQDHMRYQQYILPGVFKELEVGPSCDS